MMTNPTMPARRYTFHDCNGNPVIDAYDNRPYATEYGPRSAADIARQLSGELGYTVLWRDNAQPGGKPWRIALN